MLSPYQRIILAATLAGSAQFGFAQETTESTETASEPKPKGYDESFQTGDIPKPSSPELDPDANSDVELNPDQNPDRGPLSDNGSGLASDNFMIGATASLTFPHLINIGVESVILQKYGISLNYGNVTRSISDVDIAMKHMDVRFRWFPWQSSFFAGLALGQHQVTGETDENITEPTSKKTVSTHGKLLASANYIIPHLGWFLVWDSGFTLGADLGYLIPSGSKSTFSATFTGAPAGTESTLRETTDYKNLKKDLEDAANEYASKPIPYVTLMRMGWMF